MEATGRVDEHTRDGLKAGLRVTWAGIVANILLFFLKLLTGLLGRSQALIADAVHSLSDLFSDFVVLLGLKLGRKEEDEDHPFGHARIETLSGMMVGAILVIVGIAIAYNAVITIYEHRISRPGLFTVVAAFVSIVVKEGLYQYTVTVGRRIKSLAVVANAWHHRTDAFSSVAVLIGVTAAYLNPAWHLADALAAIVVVFFIAKVGAALAWEGFKQVIDTAPDRRILDRLVETAQAVKGVWQVHDVRARYSGSQIFVEMHIVVDAELTVREGHRIADEVRNHVVNEVDDVTYVIVHVDPEDDADRV
ncbi:MAG: cation transporter [Candidatus Zixiibacteriota bacterium]|nr:MAG: cation transporter [candidate division Zixibacteria bacterium]